MKHYKSITTIVNIPNCANLLKNTLSRNLGLQWLQRSLLHSLMTMPFLNQSVSIKRSWVLVPCPQMENTAHEVCNDAWQWESNNPNGFLC
jgi:hypothetical protein